MLTEKKLREKVEELKAQKLSAVIEWEEGLARSENPLNDGVLPGNLMSDQRFRLESISTTKAKLYMYDDSLELFVGVMIVDK